MTPSQRADIAEKLEAIIEKRKGLQEKIPAYTNLFEEFKALNADVLELAQALLIALPDANEQDHSDYFAWSDRQREARQQDNGGGGST